MRNYIVGMFSIEKDLKISIKFDKQNEKRKFLDHVTGLFKQDLEAVFVFMSLYGLKLSGFGFGKKKKNGGGDPID
ncbi:CLUMA_CG005248, isoform A [Clunio marinus]|uniref:CLUMA_CG005248, isoform A n=1 Tax=Clunio marinus TaxID=568069 RepID=A0A1J1HVL3_9DIPT|nr:CLUMA_CG005248, isoform A [Clunio marinus]